MPAPSTLFTAVWGAWAISWILAALWAGGTVRREASGTLALAYGLIAASIVVPVGWHARGVPVPRGWSLGIVAEDALAVAAIQGFLFAWWARLHLGRLWSAEIVARTDQRIVETGPYAWVRHPIYTGILWAALATDIADASLPAALSFVCLLAGFRLKAGLEERFLQQIFTDESYAAYQRRVPMLVPALWP